MKVENTVGHRIAWGMNEFPVVGMGCTENCYTDRHAYTIVEVVNAKTIRVQRDIATRTDSNGMSEIQDYSYSPDATARVVTVTLRKDGKWHRGRSMRGNVYVIGHRREYHDFSF